MTAPETQAEPDERVGTKLGNYRLVRVLGRGRMGVVYLADDAALLRPTAVKVLSWLGPAKEAGLDPVQWFLSEARLVARINHPRVVQVYGAAQAGNLFYIAMEYVPGQSAEERIKQGPLSALEATSVIVQVAAALQAAHRVGVVHRDVKPANVLIAPGGVVKLGDFGMALTSRAAQANPGLRAGTPDYTAPEVWLGSPASPSADLYSLGATFFHLLTGRPPYPGRDLGEVRSGHVGAKIADPRALQPSVPVECAAVVQRLLSKTPGGRHSSARVLLWDLRHLQQQLEAAQGSLAQQPAPPRAKGGERGPQPGPVSNAPPLEASFTGEPLAGLRASLAAWAAQDDAPLLAVTGGWGSGRTTLLRQLAADPPGGRHVLFTDLERDPREPSPLRQLCRLAGAAPEEGGLPGRSEDLLDALLERLGAERGKGRPPPLVVLDGVGEGELLADSEVAMLAGAAAWACSFKLALIGPPGLGARLAACGLDLGQRAVPELRVPSLRPAEVGAYVRARLAARPAPRPLVVLSPDAALLVARRSQGVLRSINLLVDNMLALAAAERRLVLTSWHAWAASDSERWAKSPPTPWPAPRKGWPTPDFLALIDACRRDAGAPGFPRPARRPGRGSPDPS